MQKNIETPEAQSKNGHAVNNIAVRIGLGIVIILPWVIWANDNYQFYRDYSSELLGFGLLLSISLIATLTFKGLLALLGKKTASPAPFIGMFFLAFFVSACLFSSTSGHACNETSNTVSELRGLKAAASMYATDHPEFAENLFDPQTNYIELIKGYMDNPAKIQPERFTFRVTPQVWWIGCNLATADVHSRARLTGRAKVTGLYGSSSFDIPPVSSDVQNLYRGENRVVWMPIPIPSTASGDTTPPRPGAQAVSAVLNFKRYFRSASMLAVSRRR